VSILMTLTTSYSFQLEDGKSLIVLLVLSLRSNTHNALRLRSRDDDWRHTEEKNVSLVAGVNTIKVKVPFGNTDAPNIDYLKIEGLPSPTISSNFRNPPHFLCKKPMLYSFVILCSFLYLTVSITFMTTLYTQL
jgi:hypothetical protein